MENWKTVPIATDYAVSDMGNFKRITPYRRKRDYGGVKPSRNNRGYAFVHLRCDNGAYRNLQVHRLVMLAFVGPSDLQVNHKNGIKTDNRLANLEYVTPSQNRWHAINALDNHSRGEKHHNAKLTSEAVEAAHALRALNWSAAKIGKVIGCTGSNVLYITKGTAWAHKHPGSSK